MLFNFTVSGSYLTLKYDQVTCELEITSEVERVPRKIYPSAKKQIMIKYIKKKENEMKRVWESIETLNEQRETIMKLKNMDQEELQEMRVQIDKQLETFKKPIDDFIQLENEIEDFREKADELKDKEPQFIKDIEYITVKHTDSISILGGPKRKDENIENYEGVSIVIKTKEIVCDLNTYDKPSDEICKIIEDYFQTKIKTIEKREEK